MAFYDAGRKIRKGDKFFVNGEFNPNAARLITAAHDAYFWVPFLGKEEIR